MVIIILLKIRSNCAGSELLRVDSAVSSVILYMSIVVRTCGMTDLRKLVAPHALGDTLVAARTRVPYDV